MSNFWKNKKVLVTGGAGFIGSFVCELLLNKGANVRITTKSGDISNIIHLQKELEIIRQTISQPTRPFRIKKV